MRVWKKMVVEMEIKKGVQEGRLLVKIVGKDGKLKKYVMREVEKLWGEEEDEEKDIVDW
jgi:hypothetical protein